MDNLDLPGMSVLMMLGATIVRIIPPICILAAGIWAVGKHYTLSGVGLIVSSILEIVRAGFYVFVFAVSGGAWSYEVTIWVMQGAGLIASILLVTSVFGIVSSLPTRQL